MKPHEIVLWTLLFVFIFTGTGILLSNINTNYAEFTQFEDDSYSNVTSSMDQLANTTNDMRSIVLKGNTTSMTSLDTMIAGAYSAIRLITAPIEVIDGIFKVLTSALRLPPFIADFALVAIIVTIIFSIIYLIFRAA